MNAKQLIQGIRKQLTSRGLPAGSKSVGDLVGVSHGSIDNWWKGRSATTDENMAKLENALANLKLTGGTLPSTELPPEIAPRKHKKARNKKTVVVGDLPAPGRLKQLLGGLSRAEESTTEDEPTHPITGNPIDSGMKIPNIDAETAKLRAFLTKLRLKAISTAAPVLCDDGRVIWHFVAQFTHESPEIIIKRCNEHNRVVGVERAKKYGRDMANRRWGYAGETIVFDSNEDLIDGQNRMNALRAYYKEFPDAPLLAFLVVVGVNREASTFSGRGFTRSNIHQNQMEGRAYDSVRSLTMNMIHRGEQSGDGRDYMEELGSDKLESSRQTVLNEFYADEIDPALEFVHGLDWRIGTKALSKHVAVFMLMVLSRKSPQAARFFMKSIADGTLALPGPPLCALRARLGTVAQAGPGPRAGIVLKQINKGDSVGQISRASEAMVMRYIAAGWNSFCSGKKNTAGKFHAHGDGSMTTIQILGDLAEPGPKALREAEQFTPEAHEKVISKARLLREAAQAKMVRKNRDDDDSKLDTIAKSFSTD